VPIELKYLFWNDYSKPQLGYCTLNTGSLARFMSPCWRLPAASPRIARLNALELNFKGPVANPVENRD
jgi:hypothetical protein